MIPNQAEVGLYLTVGRCHEDILSNINEISRDIFIHFAGDCTWDHAPFTSPLPQVRSIALVTYCVPPPVAGQLETFRSVREQMCIQLHAAAGEFVLRECANSL